MRMAIVGKSGSGKSTATHRVLSHALRHEWAGVLLLDGKGSELATYNGLPGVTYYGPDELDQWAAALTAHVDRMAERYKDLISRGLREATDDDPSYLIVADEIQKGTRDDTHGKAIRKAFMIISEQCRAVHDSFVVVTQREVNAVPPSARHNIEVWLRMLGKGYFHLASEGAPTSSGRAGYITPEDALAAIRSSDPPAPMTPAAVTKMLGCIDVEPTRSPATLYMGIPGSGKTYRLHNHKPARSVSRKIYIDLSQPHRQVLTELIEQAGAVAPRVTIPQLVEIACLALQAEPTLLMMDNLDRASAGMLPTVETLLEFAQECVIACTTNGKKTGLGATKLSARVKTIQIERLNDYEALNLVRHHLPEVVTDRAATERKILELGRGHPATLVDLSTRTQQGTLAEVREYVSAQSAPINISWLLGLPLLAAVLLYRADGYAWAAVGMFILLIARRIAMQQIRGIIGR